VSRGVEGGAHLLAKEGAEGANSDEGTDRREIITVRGQSYVSRLPK
jgi:hypothetical protein